MRLVPIQETGIAPSAVQDPSGSVPGVVEQVTALYARRGFVPPWLCYLAEEQGAWIGTCGFTGPPSNGEAEIAYFTFPGNEGRGVATRMATALLALSASDVASQGIALIAHTMPEEGASTTILRKL